MDEEQKKKIAMFRFGVIADLVGRKDLERGEREAIIRELAGKQWEIPFSGRSSVSRSTIREWLRRYQRSGQKLESLFPKDRQDEGRSRSIDAETELALVSLRRELKRASLPVLLRVARKRKILPPDFTASPQSVYRMFRRHGLHRERISPQDRRRFEAELPNDLWQADRMHGPRVISGGKLRKTFLFACIDDHSRLITAAKFYLRENIACFIDCLMLALQSRGLPRKLYVDYPEEKQMPKFDGNLFPHKQIALQTCKHSVYRCGAAGHTRIGVLRDEVWEDSGGVRKAARGRAGAR